MDNVRMTGKKGGTFNNVDVHIRNSDFQFSESAFDVSTDESVAIVEEVVKAGMQDQLIEVIRALKTAPQEEQKSIVQKSSLSKIFSNVKDISGLIKLFLELGKELS